MKKPRIIKRNFGYKLSLPSKREFIYFSSVEEYTEHFLFYREGKLIFLVHKEKLPKRIRRMLRGIVEGEEK